MMKKQFKTRDEALAYGYTPHTQPPHGGIVKDTSGPNQFGYQYTEYDKQGNVLAVTVDVWLDQETNKGKSKGAVAVMFPPG